MDNDQFLSSFDNPDQVMAATEAALADEAPRLPPAPDGVVTLPAGYVDDSGINHRSAVVREMTGADEEALAVVMKGKDANPLDFTDAALSRCVTSIGPYEVTKEIAQRLLRGDRDALVLAIRVATYGPKLDGTITCPSCGEKLDAEIDLTTDIPAKEAEDASKRVHTVDLRNGQTAEVRFVTGEDQWILTSMARTSSLPEMNTTLLSRCVLSIGGQQLFDGTKDPEQKIRELGKADRETLLNFLTEERPGPRPEEVKVPCAACGEDIPTPVDLASLLL